MKEKMKLSTTTDTFFRLFGYEDGVKALAEIGFDALDMNLITCIYDEEFSDANLEKMRKNGPVTDRMRQDVIENVYHNSLVTWVKSFQR